MRVLLTLLLAGAPGLAPAQANFAPPPPPPVITAASAPLRPLAAAPAASAASAVASDKNRPHLRVIEDDDVRIEEERRSGGQTRRITVQSKIEGVKPYEIIVPPGGKDALQDRGAAGQRAWSLFTF